MVKDRVAVIRRRCLGDGGHEGSGGMISIRKTTGRLRCPSKCAQQARERRNNGQLRLCSRREVDQQRGGDVLTDMSYLERSGREGPGRTKGATLDAGHDPEVPDGAELALLARDRRVKDGQPY